MKKQFAGLFLKSSKILTFSAGILNEGRSSDELMADKEKMALKNPVS